MSAEKRLKNRHFRRLASGAVCLSLLASTNPALAEPINLRSTLKIELPGSQLRLKIQQSPGSPLIERKKTVTWLRSAARSVTTVYGFFPLRQVDILVTPTNRGNGPIPFGQVERQPNTHVNFFIQPDQPLQAFLNDWTAVHEFAHLLLPFIDRDTAWLAEGIATYYQYVARVRGGIISENQAWTGLLAGLERGRHNTTSGITLRQASRQMHEQQSYMRVYWSGVMFALTTDVELRRQSGGTKSLDQALLKFNHCCLPSHESWQAEAFLSQLDKGIDSNIFTKNLHAYDTRTDFPASTRLLIQLGVISINGAITVNDSATLAPIRRQIMAADELSSH